jgi:trans-aconitate 2-methyltransferase
MPTWNADQYLKFAGERTRPCRDLVAAIAISNVRRIIDLGCGPGNSTSVLAARWPDAEIVGLDNSASMIQAARAEQPNRTWIVRDIAQWAATKGEPVDVVFSNAALHWIENHERLFPKLLEHVSPGGVLAAQLPADLNATPHRLMRELAPPNASVKQWRTHDPDFYYDVLSPHAELVDIWETVYQHVLPNAEAIVEWYKGTGLRPYLEAFKTDDERNNFLAEYLTRIKSAFTPRPDGKVLLPFRRLFVIAKPRPH